MVRYEFTSYMKCVCVWVVPLYLKQPFQTNLFSAGSISLDSTFQGTVIFALVSVTSMGNHRERALSKFNIVFIGEHTSIECRHQVVYSLWYGLAIFLTYLAGEFALLELNIR